MNHRLLLIASLLLLGTLVQAEDFPFHTDSSTAEQIEKGLSEKEGLKESDEQTLSTNKLEMGGSLRHDVSVYQFKDAAVDDFMQNPTDLSLYLDSALSGDVRGFFRGKFTYDATVDPTTTTSPIPGTTYSRSISQLDEMKIQFPIEKTLFMSVGIQKIKWGSGHFWNPTDFLNTQAKDLLEKEDRRAGLDLVKAHVPFKDMNFYAIADLGNANQSKNVGAALRAEVPWTNAWFNGEFSFSQFTRRSQAAKYGFDLSMGLGPVDVILETAKTKDDKSGSTVAGVSYDWQYSDEDFLNLNFEAYQNEAGVTSTSDYPALLLSQNFLPFHVAKTYHLTSIYFPKPGRWQHSDILLMFVQNGVDHSLYSRVGYTWTGIKDLSLSMFVGARSGDTDSEMRLANMTTDYLLRTEVKF